MIVRVWSAVYSDLSINLLVIFNAYRLVHWREEKQPNQCCIKKWKDPVLCYSYTISSSTFGSYVIKQLLSVKIDGLERNSYKKSISILSLALFQYSSNLWDDWNGVNELYCYALNTLSNSCHFRVTLFISRLQCAIKLLFIYNICLFIWIFPLFYYGKFLLDPELHRDNKI